MQAAQTLAHPQIHIEEQILRACADAGVRFQGMFQPTEFDKGLVLFDCPASHGSTLAVSLPDISVELIRQHIADWCRIHRLAATQEPEDERLRRLR